MRCAVSFVTVTVLSIAVATMAVYIIVITGKVEDCDTGYYCLVSNVSTCVKPCNGVSECDDGSDEEGIYCDDVQTTITNWLGILKNCNPLYFPEPNLKNESNETFNSSVSELEVKDKPENCGYLKAENDTQIGVFCIGAMNATWNDGIPWDRISNLSRVVYECVLNVTELKDQNISKPREFPVMKSLSLNDNHIEHIGSKAVCHISDLCSLSLQGNAIRDMSQDAFCTMKDLSILDMNSNKITLKGFTFRDMPGLKALRLDHNEIEEINRDTFRELESLLMLNLAYNKIHHIHPNAFEDNHKLIELDLRCNRLITLDPNVFQSQRHLKKLYITENPDIYIQAEVFVPLTNLAFLNAESLDLSQFNTAVFQNKPSLDIVFLKKFEYCKYLPTARRCYPASDGLSSSSNLLMGQNRIAVWCVGILTVFGNVFVLANQWSQRRSRSGRSEIPDILNIFVKNLAVSDLLMGVYLIILGVKDVQLRGIYRKESFNWARSWQCSFTGVIAMISSEASLLTLTILSLDRYLTIRAPFNQQRQTLNLKLARASMLIIWLFATTLALAPVVQWQTDQILFYGSTALCFPIHLNEPYPIGWQYTAFIFMGVNATCLALTTVCYSMLFQSVQSQQRETQTPQRRQNIELAMRCFLVVVTDMLCWAPIIFLKWAVFYGRILTSEIIVWVVIYILPLNAAVNPILYTFSTREARDAVTLQVNRLLGLVQLVPQTEASRDPIDSEDHGVPRN